MKTIIQLFFISGVLLFGISSCKKEEEKKDLNCFNGYIPNCTSTECECPKSTHYEIGPFGGALYGDCYKKEEFTYKTILYGNHCFYHFDTSLIDSSSIGLLKFEGVIPRLYFGGHSSQQQVLNSGISAPLNSSVDLIEHDNGQIEIEIFGQLSTFTFHNCPEMAEKTESLVFTTYAHGISNEANTEMTIEIIYIDGFGVNIDTGYVYLWK